MESSANKKFKFKDTKFKIKDWNYEETCFISYDCFGDYWND